MKLYYQKYFIIVCLTALIYFVVKTAVILKFIDHDYLVNVFEYAVFIFLLYYQFLFYKSYKKNIKKGISDLEYFLDNVAIISKADSEGKITYVNKKFEEVSGWKLEEVIDRKSTRLSSH